MDYSTWIIFHYSGSRSSISSQPFNMYCKAETASPSSSIPDVRHVREGMNPTAPKPLSSTSCPSTEQAFTFTGLHVLQHTGNATSDFPVDDRSCEIHRNTSDAAPQLQKPRQVPQLDSNNDHPATIDGILSREGFQHFHGSRSNMFGRKNGFTANLAACSKATRGFHAHYGVQVRTAGLLDVSTIILDTTTSAAAFTTNPQGTTPTSTTRSSSTISTTSLSLHSSIQWSLEGEDVSLNIPSPAGLSPGVSRSMGQKRTKSKPKTPKHFGVNMRLHVQNELDVVTSVDHVKLAHFWL